MAAASGGNENAIAFLGQLFGNSSMPMPVAHVPQVTAVPPTDSSVQQGQIAGMISISASNLRFQFKFRFKVIQTYNCRECGKWINYSIARII